MVRNGIQLKGPSYLRDFQVRAGSFTTAITNSEAGSQGWRCDGVIDTKGLSSSDVNREEKFFF